MNSIFDYEPRRMLEIFSEISSIPRSSGNEKAVADYIEEFAHKLGLKVYRDALNNILITYTAKDGGEPVLLQAHTDMVCVKTPDSNHDFDRDPLKLFVDENGFLGAMETSLGADDGIGVAVILSLLKEKPDVSLECLFTTAEETGMDGAIGFDYSKITARRMINLDSEDENEAVVSSAGGCRMLCSKKYSVCRVNGSALEICINGFAGGHSGTEIHLGRTNAARLLAKILLRLCEKYDCRIISLCGGDKSNAIPTHAEARLVVPQGAEAEVTELFKRARKTFCEADEAAEISIARFDYEGEAFDMHSSKQICRVITTVKNGVVSRYEDIDLVKTSLNCGIVTARNGEFEITVMARSSDDGDLKKLTESVKKVMDDNGVSMSKGEEYPSWIYENDSDIRKAYTAAFAKVYGREPRVCGLHAGLECSYIKSAIPNMDIISLGPTVYDVHTVNERLDIASCERFKNLLSETVINAKKN